MGAPDASRRPGWGAPISENLDDDDLTPECTPGGMTALQMRMAQHRVGQPSLLDDLPTDPHKWPDGTRIPSQPWAVRERDPETSIAAAKRQPPVHKSRLAGDIFVQHQLHPEGLTDDEVVQLLGDVDRGVVARRRLDLLRRGLLEDSGLRRPTRTGSLAIVWRLVAR